MKKAHRIQIVFIIVLLLLLWLLTSCKTKMIPYPVESVKTEYKDKLIKDSIHILDSVFLYSRNDTVFLNKYRYMYKDKLIKDTVNVTDTIRVPYPVEIEKEVNRLNSFQSFQIWCGRILLLILLGWFGIFLAKQYFK